MTVEYIYQLLGMKEASLNLVIAERDQIKAKLKEAETEIKRLSDLEDELKAKLKEAE